MTRFVPKRSKQQLDSEEEERSRLVKDSIVLCINHLISLGYIESADKLSAESGIPTDKYDVCDNINLMSVLTDFESYLELKYGTRPKLTKLNPKSTSQAQNQTKQKPKTPTPTITEPKPTKVPKKLTPLSIEPPKSQGGKRETDDTEEHKSVEPPKPIPKPKPNVPAEVRLLKPIPMQLRSEYGELTMMIAHDIYVEDPGVKWTDIVGLSGAKRLLKEAVVMPLRCPQIFERSKLLSPWKGVLLHGPPGTGKTLLAKAVAGEGTTFFNVSASTLVSKWRGDSEKLIRILFELARYHAPSTIFIDEIDSIMSTRSSSGEHEASRRMKTEMLAQMDGLVQNDVQVFVLAASNFPFDLDPALLRRLEKRVYVPLPEAEAREDLFRKLLTEDIIEPNLPFDEFVQKTEGYSGSDIKLVCKEAAMEPLRRKMQELQEKYGDDYLDESNMSDVQLDPITAEDVFLSLSRTSPSATYDISKYVKWQEQFGVT